MKKLKFVKLISAFLAIAMIGEFQIGSRVVLAAETDDNEAIETGSGDEDIDPEDPAEDEDPVDVEDPADDEDPADEEGPVDEDPADEEDPVDVDPGADFDPIEECLFPELIVEEPAGPDLINFKDEDPIPEGDCVPNEVLFSVIQYGSDGNQLCETSPVCEDNLFTNVRHVASVPVSGFADEGTDAYEVIYVATVETDDVLAYAKYLRTDDRIVHADPNYISYIDEGETTEEDELFSRVPLSSSEKSIISNNCWYMKAINAEYAWKRILNHNPGDGVVVAVIDTGIYTGHVELKNQMWVNPGEIPGNGRDDDGNGYIDDVNGACTADSYYRGNIQDTYGHGTFCAGLIAAQGGNKNGFAGVAYGAKLMAVKASSGRTLTDDAILRGIQYAYTMHANVINMSFGGYYYSQTKEVVCQQAATTAVLVAAAGNDAYATADYPGYKYSRRDCYPAAFSVVLGVMSSTSSNALSYFSNWDYSGNKYQLIAPGSNIYSTTYTGGYGYNNGTSFSSPLTAGAAAVVLGEYPGQTPTFVKNMLLQTNKKTKFSDAKAGYFKHLDLSYCTWKAAPSKPLVDFCTRLYTKALGRKADPAGVQDWACALRDGATGAQVAHGFFFSKEFTNKKLSNTEYVKRLYRTFFNREADSAGLKAWVKALEKGSSREQVFYGFVNSQEWANLCCKYGINSGGTCTPNLKPTKAINNFTARLYKLCLGRAADPAGQKAWGTELVNRRATGAQVARGFFNSPEFINKKYSNTAYIKILYRVFLNREADSKGLNSWYNAMAKGATRDQVLDGFAKSPEFVAICEKAGIIPY